METKKQTILGIENTSRTFIYDGSFNGFLTAVLIGFEQRITHADMQKRGTSQNGLFTENETIFTNITQSKRVWNGIRNRSNSAIKNIYFAFLSEQKGIEPLLYSYIRKLMGCKVDRSTDPSDDCILKINQLSHKVGREKQRMEAFVRFQLTKDEVNFAQIAPDFDVLPLLSKHFRSRYADQQWIIYDSKRHYGLYYNLRGVELIHLDLEDSFVKRIRQNTLMKTEEYDFQDLWNTYIQSTNIKSRINKKLHVQHVPKGYWKYLSEKKVC